MQSLGIISILLLSIGIICMFLKWPGDKSKTLSQNAARSKSSSIYYFCIFVVFLALFSTFIVGWFIPYMHLSFVFTTIFIVGVLGQLIAVALPETQGLQKTIHVIAAGLMSLMALLITIILAINTGTSNFSRIVCGVVVILMLASWFLVIFYKKIYKHALWLQLLYFIGFFTVIMLTTYVS